MLHQGIIVGIVYNVHQVLKPSSSDDSVSIEDTITGDITDSPYSLLYNSWAVRF